MCETEHCSECGNDNIFHDKESGESVCINCGLVTDEKIYSPPADRIQKNTQNNPLAYTSSAVGTEIESFQRFERDVAKEIKWLVPMLSLPRNVSTNAVTYVRKVRNAMKKHNPRKIRFTKNELTAVSIWNALKQIKHPTSYDEFSQKIKPYVGNINLMKAEKRINLFIKNQTIVPDVELVIAHINRIVSMLEHKQLSNSYANILCAYAIQMINSNKGIVTYRRAKLVAAAAILAADSKLAEKLPLPPFAKWLNIGTGKLSSLATTLKRYAPPVPKQCASIKLQEYFLQEFGLIEA